MAGIYWKYQGLELSTGNEKVKNILILNMGACYDCSSKRLGLCKVCDMDSAGLPIRCYGLSAESHRLAVYSFRVRQGDYYRSHSAAQVCRDLDAMFRNRRKLPASFRFNEASDFNSAADVRKAEKIAKHLKTTWGFQRVWTYTARKDLLSTIKKCRHLVIKGSGWRAPAGMTAVIIGHELSTPAGFRECPGDCSRCSLCSVKGVNVVFRAHGGRTNLGRDLTEDESRDAWNQYYGLNGWRVAYAEGGTA